MAERREGVEQDAVEKIQRSQELAREAMQYWQTTLRGLFALPTATAMSVSSAVLYATGMAEQAYQRVGALTGRIGSEIQREIGEARRTAQPLPEPERERMKKQPSA